jgi:hypothetical protein
MTASACICHCEAAKAAAAIHASIDALALDCFVCLAMTENGSKLSAISIARLTWTAKTKALSTGCA